VSPGEFMCCASCRSRRRDVQIVHYLPVISRTVSCGFGKTRFARIQSGTKRGYYRPLAAPRAHLMISSLRLPLQRAPYLTRFGRGGICVIAGVFSSARASTRGLRTLFPNPATDHVDGIAWSMALTSMGAKEFWGEWEVKSDRISIGSTKANGRVRDVPLLMVPVVPRIHRRAFEDKFRQRTASARTVYDLCRSFAFIPEAAGLVRTRRRAYMGHGGRHHRALRAPRRGGVPGR
jgi:hypothetical protein